MSGRILLVEDDPSFRNVLALALELQGYLVHQADCGQKALELLSGVQPDIVISDLEMRGMDGRALCKYARSTSSLSKIPFVLLSAFVDPDAPGHLPDLPANCFLSKQVSISKLVQVIRQLLDSSAESSRAEGD